MRDVRSETENFASGKIKAKWGGGIAGDGNYRLNGPQMFYYEDGAKQLETTFATGRRIGTETFWSQDGKKKWERVFATDGNWTWRVFEESGKLKAESKWKGKTLIDPPPPTMTATTKKADAVPE